MAIRKRLGGLTAGIALAAATVFHSPAYAETKEHHSNDFIWFLPAAAIVGLVVVLATRHHHDYVPVSP